MQKILSKTLANQLQGHMNTFLHQSQTDFMKGRHITEGFVYAQ